MQECCRSCGRSVTLSGVSQCSCGSTQCLVMCALDVPGMTNVLGVKKHASDRVTVGNDKPPPYPGPAGPTMEKLLWVSIVPRRAAPEPLRQRRKTTAGVSSSLPGVQVSGGPDVSPACPDGQIIW
eukprot:CAMPEP_0113539108 /NCGR_PEP_ID=MMETSP0015_2-20120614/7740_1 /TAXON_ID=2838 /ORGANISM="Odontella" /LENGTH=124 /DNA_ID=CAMNT_0000438761 /DNA_START=209 /DNA_END=580 /DNA_ORIENTATION=+ /assembly_acc=CAM_ASM_000160